MGPSEAIMATGDTVYLDINATTPLEPDVLDVIHTTLRDAWGNASNSHSAGVQAKSVIEEARKSVADMTHANSRDIIFTSGGTEANNMVLNTALDHFRETYPKNNTSQTTVLPHIITSNIEHDSIALVLQAFEQQGKADVTFVPVRKKSGRVEPEDVVAEIRPTTCMVSLMLANNETGIIQPVREVIEQVKRLKRNAACEVPRILFHTDAAQAIGKISVDAQDLNVDYITVVGHKFYGPRIGALYCSGLGHNCPLSPMFYGGGQEKNYRPGTENTGMIAGLGKAAQLVVDNLPEYEAHMRKTRDYLEQQLELVFPGRVRFNGRVEGSSRIPNTCNVSILGQQLQGNKVLDLLQHTQASTGAACHSSSYPRASPVLVRSGVSEEVAINALRLSVGRHTTEQHIDIVVSDIVKAVKQLEKTP